MLLSHKCGRNATVRMSATKSTARMKEIEPSQDMTYFAGTALSSIGPFKSVAMFPAAALASSWPFETERVLMSSSSTPTDLEVSFAEVAGVESIMSTAGISVMILVIRKWFG